MRAPIALAVLSVALLAGCGSRGGLYTHGFQPMTPLAAGGRLVQLDAASGRVVLIAHDGSTSAALVAPAVVDAAATPDAGAVAVLSSADTDSVFQLLYPKTGAVRSVGVHGAFDRIALAPDGGFAILYSVASSSASGSVMRNLNAIAIVDLAAMSRAASGVEAAATRLTLDTDSLAPTKIIFAPRAAGAGRQLVAVLFARGLVLLDAAAPQQPPRRIAVAPQSSSSEIEVTDARFTPGLEYALLRASGLDDLVAVELGESEGAITASLNFLSGGTGLCALDLPGPTPAPAAVALYCTSNQLMVLDARGQEDGSRRLQLPEKLTAVHVFPSGKILAFDPTGTSRNVVAWDPASGKTATALLETRLERAVFSDARETAILFGRQGSDASLVVVGIEEQPSRLRLKTTAIQLRSTAQAQTLDPSGDRLFVSVGTSLARLDLGTLESIGLELGEATTSLVFLDDSDALAAIPDEGRSLQSSDAFLVDASSMDAAHTVRVQGAMFAGDLDRASGGK